MVRPHKLPKRAAVQCQPLQQLHPPGEPNTVPNWAACMLSGLCASLCAVKLFGAEQKSCLGLERSRSKCRGYRDDRARISSRSNRNHSIEEGGTAPARPFSVRLGSPKRSSSLFQRASSPVQIIYLNGICSKSLCRDASGQTGMHAPISRSDHPAADLPRLDRSRSWATVGNPRYGSTSGSHSVLCPCRRSARTRCSSATAC